MQIPLLYDLTMITEKHKCMKYDFFKINNDTMGPFHNIDYL